MTIGFKPALKIMITAGPAVIIEKKQKFRCQWTEPIPATATAAAHAVSS
jgi:hypothetical protein